MYVSNAESEFTPFNPLADTNGIFSGMPNRLDATYDLPEPGPPAVNTALNIPGSYTPSVNMSVSLIIVYK